MRREKKQKVEHRFDGNALRSLKGRVLYILQKLEIDRLHRDLVNDVLDCLRSIYEERSDYKVAIKTWIKTDSGPMWDDLLQRYAEAKNSIGDPVHDLRQIWKRVAQLDKTLTVDLELTDSTIAEHLKDNSNKYKIISTDGTCYLYNDRTTLWKEGTKMDLCGFIRSFFTRENSKYYQFGDQKDQTTFQKLVKNMPSLKKIAEALCTFGADKEFERELDRGNYIPFAPDSVLNLHDLKTGIRDQSCYCTFELKDSIGYNPFEEFKELHDQKIMTDEVRMDKIYSDLYPNCHRFFSAVLPDIGRRRFLMLRLGLALTTNMDDRTIYFLWGNGKGGKSMIFLTLLQALGDFAISAHKNIIVKASSRQSSNSHNSHNVQCKDKRLIWVNELAKGDVLDDSAVKSWVSGDIKSDREIMRRQITYQPRGKLFVTTNVLPAFNSEDSALQDRIKGVRMNVRYWSDDTPLKPSNSESRDYKDFYDKETDIHWVKITKESRKFAEDFKSGKHGRELLRMLSCLAYECLQFFKDSETGSLPVPDIILKDTQEILHAGDVVRQFLDDHCEISDDWHDGVCLDEIFTVFNKYLMVRNQKCWQRKTLSETLQARLYYHPAWKSSIGHHTKLKLVSRP